MSHFLTFAGYGVGASEVTVAVQRITHLSTVRYNGNVGTEISLDTGKSILVAEYQSDVEKRVSAALQALSAP